MGSLPNETTSISSHPTALSVAIIGGGIGGLCCAIGLLKHKHIDVQVYESAPTFGEKGAGITVGPNAQRALELIGGGAKAAFDKHATPNSWASHANNYTQNICFLDDLVNLIPKQRAHFGKRLVKLEDETDAGGRITMYFKDGTREAVDAVIGADGIHSMVRTYLLGDDHPAARPQFSGTASYRAIVGMDRAVEILGAERAENSTMLCGNGCAILSYPIEHGELLNIVLMDYQQPTWEHEKRIVPVDRGYLERRLGSWGAAGHGMIELLDQPTLCAWAMWDHPPTPRYSKGNVTMLGDAAHSTTPYQGQGAGQAIEDAEVLEVLLGKTMDKRHVANAFAAYDQVRRPRTQRVVTTSRESGQLLGMMLPGVEGDLKKMKEKLETRMHWIWNRDLLAQSESAIKLFNESL